MRFPNQSQWLAWIETQHCQQVEFGLERLSKLVARLDLQTKQPFTVTITGTNGKGSCAAFLSQLLQTAGYKVGVLTSPHLRCYNERICLQGRPITEQQLCDIFQRIDERRGEVTLPYFEWCTLAALCHFQEQEVDVQILEVGVGGRIDAVNVVDADCAVITSIALDHQHWLGDTREAIAREKFGIARSGKPLICGDHNPPANLAVLAAEQGCELLQLGRDFFYEGGGASWQFRSEELALGSLPVPRLKLQNLATALMASQRLPMTFTKEQIHEALKQVHLPGRCQVIPGQPRQVLDVAHNPASVAHLVSFLKSLPVPVRRQAVVGMFEDKDFLESLAPLIALVDVWHVCSLNVNRGAPAESIVSALRCLGVTQHKIHEYDAPALAHAQALASAERQDEEILVFGSFCVVGPVLVAIESSHQAAEAAASLQ